MQWIPMPMSRAILASAATALSWGCASAPPPPPAVEPVVAATSPVEGATCTSDDAHGMVATFPDANLERAVRNALGLARDQPLTCGSLRSLTSLHAPDARIEDLRGIAALANLEVLYVYGNNSIQDVSPLVELQGLRDLNLARNEIEDIGPLAELRSLTSLSLYGNPIRDITPLAQLTGLTRLQVEHTAGVTDLEALSGLERLTRLELSGNQIVDITPLMGLTRLTRLSLKDNAGLSDVGPLRHLVQLQILSLGGTSVTDLSPLSGLSQLNTVGLEGTAVIDLGPLIGLPHLSRVDLRGNGELTDIQPLLFNAALGSGDAVRLERTGVRCEDVTALSAKGVAVLSGCE